MARSSGEGSWRVRESGGKKSFEYRIRIDGVQKSFYGKSKAEALSKYKSYNAKPSVKDMKNVQSFYEYGHEWLFGAKKDTVKAKTFDYYEFILERFIRDTSLGDTPVRKLNETDNKTVTQFFQNHINKYKSKSKSTADGIYTVLNQICKYGMLYGDFTHNYMLGVKKLSEKVVETKKKDIPALQYDEVMKLWDEMLRKNEEGEIINNKAGTYVYGIGSCALLFCCFTGLRWGELSILKWEDIKEQNGRFFFKVDKQYVNIINRDDSVDSKHITIQDTPKSKKSERYIPLSNKAVELLDIVKKRFPDCYYPNHLIFSTTDNPMTESMVNRLLKAMCNRAGVPITTPHGLRHTFASILLNEDEKNLYTVSDLLGHSSSDVTYKKYIDIFEKKRMETMDIFDKLDSPSHN